MGIWYASWMVVGFNYICFILPWFVLDFNHVIGNHLVFFDRHAVNIEPNTNFKWSWDKVGCPYRSMFEDVSILLYVHSKLKICLTILKSQWNCMHFVLVEMFLHKMAMIFLSRFFFVSLLYIYIYICPFVISDGYCQSPFPIGIQIYIYIYISKKTEWAIVHCHPFSIANTYPPVIKPG